MSDTTDTPITDEFERATCDGLDSALEHARDLERLLNQTRALNAFQVHEWPHATTHAHQVVTLETALELQRQLAEARKLADDAVAASRAIKNKYGLGDRHVMREKNAEIEALKGQLAESMAQRDRLAEALRQCRSKSIAIQDIQYGYDGDCGSASIADEIEAITELALASLERKEDG